MNENVMRRCTEFADNCNMIRKSYKWQQDLMGITAGLIYTTAGKQPDIEKMKECSKMIEKKTGVFSSFQSTAFLVLTSKMALSDDPGKYLDDVIEVYGRIKEGFFSDNGYTVLAASEICDAGRQNEIDAITEKYKALRKSMDKAHPILTSADDIPMTMQLALSDKDNEQIMQELGECYDYMKKNSKVSGGSIWNLAQVLTLFGGSSEAKCKKVIEIFSALKEAGVKYSTDTEYASLGALIELDIDNASLAQEIKEVEDFMGDQKGMGSWTLSKKQRLMFSALLIAQELSSDTDVLQRSVIASSVVEAVALEMAMMVVIIAAAT